MNRRDNSIDWISLILGGFMVLYGIFLGFTHQTVNPLTFVCAAIVCCVHYLEKILDI